MNAGPEHNVYMQLATTLCLTRVMQVRSELFGSGRDLQWGENSRRIFASNPGMGRNVYMPEEQTLCPSQVKCLGLIPAEFPCIQQRT
jgi:hypothetical protein